MNFNYNINNQCNNRCNGRRNNRYNDRYCYCRDCAYCCKGDRGARGPRGVPGPPGRQGRPGPSGPQGERGIPGRRGPQGIQGERGFPGETGAQGEQGIQGERGLPGEPGAQGEQGIQGERGLPGETGAQGEQGIQGERGLTGETGPQGPKGDPGGCDCVFNGELLINGEMEDFTDDVPTGWDLVILPDTLILKVETPERVHSGSSSVTLIGDLFQVVEDINEGCYYELSFFARTHDTGNITSASGYVIFNTPEGPVDGGSVVIGPRSVPNIERSFGYYRVTTPPAPAGVTSAEIHLTASHSIGSIQTTVDFDSVSFVIR